MPIEISNLTITPNLIYQFGFILLIISLFLLLIVWPFLKFLELVYKYKRKNKNLVVQNNSLNQFIQNEDIEQEETPQTDNFGLTEVEENPQQKSEKVNPILRNIINDIEKSTEVLNHKDPIIQFWDDNLFYIQSELSIKKILLLKLDKQNQFKVERYKSFNLDTLQLTEDMLNSKESKLKQLIINNKNLFFTGNITISKTFQFLFIESEKNNYNQLYLFPISVDNQLNGALFLIKSNEQTSITEEQLKKMVSKISSTNQK